MTPATRRTLALLAPLAMALAACGSNTATEGGEATAAVVKPVPAPSGTQWRDTVQVTPDEGHLVGNPDAPIKLVEYGSLTCPTCAAFAVDGMEPLMAKYIDSGRVSFEMRNFAVHGPIDIVLARLVRCGEKEAVVPLSDQVWRNVQSLTEGIYANQQAVEQAMNLPMNQRFVAMAEIGKLYDFFASRGISADQARTCLADVASLEKLANQTQTFSTRDGVTGTPTFTLNGAKLEGVNSWATLEPRLQAAGAR